MCPRRLWAEQGWRNAWTVCTWQGTWEGTWYPRSAPGLLPRSTIFHNGPRMQMVAICFLYGIIGSGNSVHAVGCRGFYEINVVNNSRKEDSSVQNSKEAKEVNKAALGLDSWQNIDVDQVTDYSKATDNWYETFCKTVIISAALWRRNKQFWIWCHALFKGTVHILRVHSELACYTATDVR